MQSSMHRPPAVWTTAITVLAAVALGVVAIWLAIALLGNATLPWVTNTAPEAALPASRLDDYGLRHPVAPAVNRLDDYGLRHPVAPAVNRLDDYGLRHPAP
jgi:hypothetical protein